MPQNRVVLKKYKESSRIYGEPFRFIFLPNVIHENLKLDLDINFLSLFYCRLYETFQQAIPEKKKSNRGVEDILF